MQRDALRALDGAIHNALLGAGLASTALYLPPGAPLDSAPTPMAAYLDQGVQVFGEFGQVVGRRDELVLLPGGAAVAQRGTASVDGVTYVLQERVAEDASHTRWTVRRV